VALVLAIAQRREAETRLRDRSERKA